MSGFNTVEFNSGQFGTSPFFIGPFGYNSSKGKLRPYLGNFATRTAIPTTSIAAASSTQILGKVRHFARSAVSFIQVSFPNFFVTINTNVESGNGGIANVTAVLEYPLGTIVGRYTWSGIGNVNIASGSFSPLSDRLACSIPINTEFYTQYYYSNPSGTIEYAATPPINIDTTHNEQFRFAVSGLTDQTGNTGAFTGGSTSTALNYGPCLVVSTITNPTVLLIGDSRCQGFGDTYVGNLVTSTEKGQTARSIGAYFGYINIGVFGTQAGQFPANSSVRQLLSPYCSHVLCEYGVNDVYAGTAATTVVTRIKAIQALFPGKNFYQTTLPPETTSTDSWATAVNQTVKSDESIRTSFNDLVRAGISGVTNYFDVADIAETSRNSGIWIANGSANYATADGVHETKAMNELILASGIINPNVFNKTYLFLPTTPGTSANLVSGSAGTGNSLANTNFNRHYRPLCADVGWTNANRTGDSWMIFQTVGADSQLSTPGQVSPLNDIQCQPYTKSSNTMGTMFTAWTDLIYGSLAFAAFRNDGESFYRIYLPRCTRALSNNTATDVALIKSTDLTGTSWSTQTVVIAGSGNVEFGGRITTADGNWALVVFSDVNNSGKTSLYKTTNNGDSFSLYSTIPGTSSNYSEGDFITNPNNPSQVLGVLRLSTQGYLKQVTSSDYGLTWSAITDTGLGGGSGGAGVKVNPRLVVAPGNNKYVTTFYYDRNINRQVISSTTTFANAFNGTWIAYYLIGTNFDGNCGMAVIDESRFQYLLLTDTSATPSNSTSYWVYKDIFTWVAQ